MRRSLFSLTLLACVGSVLVAGAQEPADRIWLPKTFGWPFGTGAAPTTPDASKAPVRIIVTSRNSLGQRAYCVRLCDGFYFPVTGLRNGDTEQEAELCGTLCPGAKTAVYTLRGNSDSIGNAVNGAKTYASLSTAFAYRKNVASHCSCQKRGVPALALNLDPTLKSGDVVMTQTGVRVFRGSRTLPYREQDFVAYASSNALPSSMRDYLAMIDRPYRNKRLAAERQKIADSDKKSAEKPKVEQRTEAESPKHEPDRMAQRVARQNRNPPPRRYSSAGFSW